jgi:uncharacterized membrane protein
MTAKRWVFAYLIAVPVFFAVDMVWLGLIAADYYAHHLGHLLGPVNWPAAFLFYLMFVAGIVIFGVRPALMAGSLTPALLWGGLYGFFTYGTYELTNLATLKHWPWTMAIIDIGWGIFLSALVATVTSAIMLFLDRR